ncbi:haloacid dehalogenase [Pluteus cervinus]|uniref:Haloacid dehalogenase n=1 Tax=Pluteus cervinus TaxID=181527 RepID=A0ACD3AJA9_9AGAR|nr:haloacid dehalogenase [Pluteus cervinus]
MTLDNVDALLFDVFGTVVDWRSSVTAELEAFADRKGISRGTVDWGKFAQQWRTGYIVNTRKIAEGGGGPSNVDLLHRQLLDELLASSEWATIANYWTEDDRQYLNLAWHRLKGWPDTTEGLYALKKQRIIATLSNGNVRLLVDMAKHSDLPWDAVFSGDLFGSYKPNPKVYLGGPQQLSLPTEKCAMVAAHIHDLRAAASHGYKTIYVRRSGEDVGISADVKSKTEGGDVDIIVDSFIELAEVLKRK